MNQIQSNLVNPLPQMMATAVHFLTIYRQIMGIEEL